MAQKHFRCIRQAQKVRYLVWGVSDAGSDWSTWYAKDLGSGEDLSEVLIDIKNDSPSWLPDESGYYYSRYPNANSDGHIETTDASELWFHAIGSSSDQKTNLFGVTLSIPIVFMVRVLRKMVGGSLFQ